MAPIVPVIRSIHAPDVAGDMLSSTTQEMVTSIALHSVRRGIVSSLVALPGLRCYAPVDHLLQTTSAQKLSAFLRSV
jgi:hypothetical protein